MNAAMGRFAKDTSGVTALIFSLAAPAALVLAGGAVVYGQARAARSVQQNALDAAVLSGAAMPLSSTDAERINAAQATFQAKINDSSKNVAQSASAAFSVEAIDGGNVQVTGVARAAVKNAFSGFLGSASVPIGTRAVAKTSKDTGVCVYALNARANGALDLNGNVSVSTTCPVQVNSGSAAAVRAVGAAKMNTTSFAVGGNYKGDAFTPPPSTGAAQMADPFSSVAFPTSGSCASLSGASIKTSTTIDPGTFCGGLRISSGAVVTLNPGIYIFKDGDFKVDGGASVNGREVMLAFDGKGAKFWLSGGAVMKLTSPSSGPYANMQFMENRNNTSGNTWVSIGGNSQLDYDGVMYFPLSNIWVFGGSIVNGNSPTVTMVGDKLWFQDNSTITLTQTNARNLQVASPSQQTKAVLVQ